MHVVVVVMMMMMMMVVMHLMRHRSGGGRFLSDSVACKADCESGRSDKALDHGSTVLNEEDPFWSSWPTMRLFA